MHSVVRGGSGGRGFRGGRGGMGGPMGGLATLANPLMAAANPNLFMLNA